MLQGHIRCVAIEGGGVVAEGRCVAIEGGGVVAEERCIAIEGGGVVAEGRCVAIEGGGVARGVGRTAGARAATHIQLCMARQPFADVGRRCQRNTLPLSCIATMHAAGLARLESRQQPLANVCMQRDARRATLTGKRAGRVGCIGDADGQAGRERGVHR
eukprot:357759-Chlamydomonas_euryale.AAC.3